MSMSEANKAFHAKQQKIKAAIGALALTAGIAPRAKMATGSERIDGWVSDLLSGTTVKKGVDKKLSFTETAQIVLKLVKAGAGDRVPQEARDRFPWGAASQEAIDALAELAGVEPRAFMLAVGLGARIVDAEPEPVSGEVPADPVVAAAAAADAALAPAPAPRRAGGRRG